MCTLTKSELRKEIKQKLAKMSYFDKAYKSEVLVDDVIASGILYSYANVLLYQHLENEVNVDRLIQYALASGKKVYLPRVEGDKIVTVQYPCPLEKGAYGVLEPVGEASGVYPKVVITPLLAVDKQGNRMGKGKGYYDRYFAEAGECYKIGVAFSNQVVDELEVEEHDVPLDKVFVR